MLLRSFFHRSVAPSDLHSFPTRRSSDLLVVVSLPGTVLPGDFAIAARKTYGHTSDGMICSGEELGLGPDADGVDGIIVLGRGHGAGLSAERGDDAIELLGLADEVVEINVTRSEEHTSRL